MESWRTVWRTGIVPHLSMRALEALRDGLATNSPEIICGATTTPPPMLSHWPVEAACPVGYALWRGEDLDTVTDVQRAFSEVCHAAGLRLGDQAACRWLLNWIDESPWDEVRPALLAEVELALAARRLPVVEAGQALEMAG